MRRLIVRALNGACLLVDAIVYRPAIIKLTARLPRRWNCEFGRAAVRLDDRWQLRVFGDWGPGGCCEVCDRRAAWLTVGGSDPDDPDPADTEIEICFWCVRSPLTDGADSRRR